MGMAFRKVTFSKQQHCPGKVIIIFEYIVGSYGESMPVGPEVRTKDAANPIRIRV
eukprot:COSAG02_NODE_2856_length_7888_cov_6.880216_1_plen_55_part_00